MVYESSYESGRQPFQPDTKRGKWLNPNDFIYAGISLAFRIDVINHLWLGSVRSRILAFFCAYLLSMVIYIVPFIVIQSFMGQFSSSGFISALRLSPIFKGIGYVTLVMNTVILVYQSTFAMAPLIFMFASMQPTLPWSCEGFKKWATNLTEQEEINLCNITPMNRSDWKEYLNEYTNETVQYQELNSHQIPSALYYESLHPGSNEWHTNDVEFSLSWQLALCDLLVWLIIALVVYKYFKTETIGVLIRYSLWTVLGLMLLFIVRFSFLPGAMHIFYQDMMPTWEDLLNGIYAIPFLGLSAFGSGWGLLVALSSHNKFKTNIIKFSWIIAFGQFGVHLGSGFLKQFSEGHFSHITNDSYYSLIDDSWILYLSSGSAMAHMPWANLWSILFFFMLFLSTMILMIIQLYSILTTIFDEFVYLRERRLAVSMGVVASLALTSIFFTSIHGIYFFFTITFDIGITQTVINLLMLLVVLWIYGRNRFQRDIGIMINQHFSTWNINILRFLAPLGMLVVLVTLLELTTFEHRYSDLYVDLLAVLFIGIPWLSIPGYAIYQMTQSMGTIKTRFLRCCRPTDWCPVDTEDRQKYEKAIRNVDITYTLCELVEQDVL